ncbi:AI-2E family transporter [Cucumibacter marinus]|uniref:AI-2E family transporter n=1 Tax=Cucumibacter marinus TaxID=1121252 RepID=UPI0003F662C0|nr:AI-2E family transporter [Cucumibacter marinus]
MTLQNQLKTWLVLLAASILFLWVFRGILLPFVMGIVLAYLLDPVADFLERMKFSRLWATLTILVLAIGLFIGIFVLLIPPFIEQLYGLIERLPSYVNALQEWIRSIAPQIQEQLGAERVAELEKSLDQLINNAVGIVAGISTRVAQSGLTIINALGLLVVTPVVAFYLLLDWDNIVAKGDAMLPRRYLGEIRGVFGEIDKALAGFIRGQGSVVLILAAFYSTTLSLAGLNFGLAIGLAAGLFSFVPYVGFLIGFILSIGVAIVQFWPDGLMIGVIFAIFIIGQFLEGNILYPKLVGSSIGLHPVALMFALFAFALLFGAVGVLLAVPLAAIAGVLVRYGVAKYKGSSLYLTGEFPEEDGENKDNDGAKA